MEDLLDVCATFVRNPDNFVFTDDDKYDLNPRYWERFLAPRESRNEIRAADTHQRPFTTLRLLQLEENSTVLLPCVASFLNDGSLQVSWRHTDPSGCRLWRSRHWLDLDVDVLLPVVHPHHAANHLGDNDHIPEVGLDGLGLLAVRCLPLRLAQLLQKCDRGALDATAELPPLACTEELHEVLVAHVEELVKVDTAVGILAEGPLLGLVLVTHLGGWLCTVCGLGVGRDRQRVYL